MALAIDFDADVAAAISDLPTTITIGGADYSAVASEVSRGETVMMEGVLAEVDCRVVMRVATLAAPSIGTKATIGGRAYRIARVSDSPCGTSYQLDLVAATK